MAENKTKPTDSSVEKYIASRAHAQQEADCRELMVLFKKITLHSPRMGGPSIVPRPRLLSARTQECRLEREHERPTTRT